MHNENIASLNERTKMMLPVENAKNRESLV